MPGGDALPRCLDSHQADSRIIEEAAEDPHGIGASTDAGHDGVGQPGEALQHLRARLAADHGLEVTHHAGEWVGADHGPDDVVSGRHIGDPIAERLIGRVLQRPGA